MINERYKDIENVTIEESTLDDANIKSKITIEKQNQRIKTLENDLTLLGPGGGAERPPLSVFRYCF